MRSKLISRSIQLALSLLVLVFSFGFSLCFAADATDPLATVLKPQIQALFGPGSTVAYGIYVAELVLGGIAYVKSKNLLILLGVPIVVLFTNAMFSYIGS